MSMEITAIITAAAAISGIILGWLGRSRTVRQDGAQDGELRASVKYIRDGVDDLRVEIKSQSQRYDLLAERLTRVEESAKQAHKRIDRLEDDTK
jgi:septal ring factor EnvC (AmiA/AmiB activator)